MLRVVLDNFYVFGEDKKLDLNQVFQDVQKEHRKLRIPQMESKEFCEILDTFIDYFFISIDKSASKIVLVADLGA